MYNQLHTKKVIYFSIECMGMPNIGQGIFRGWRFFQVEGVEAFFFRVVKIFLKSYIGLYL